MNSWRNKMINNTVEFTKDQKWLIEFDIHHENFIFAPLKFSNNKADIIFGPQISPHINNHAREAVAKMFIQNTMCYTYLLCRCILEISKWEKEYPESYLDPLVSYFLHNHSSQPPIYLIAKFFPKSFPSIARGYKESKTAGQIFGIFGKDHPFNTRYFEWEATVILATKEHSIKHPHLYGKVYALKRFLFDQTSSADNLYAMKEILAKHHNSIVDETHWAHFIMAQIETAWDKNDHALFNFSLDEFKDEWNEYAKALQQTSLF